MKYRHTDRQLFLRATDDKRVSCRAEVAMMRLSLISNV